MRLASLLALLMCMCAQLLSLPAISALGRRQTLALLHGGHGMSQRALLASTSAQDDIMYLIGVSDEHAQMQAATADAVEIYHEPGTTAAASAAVPDLYQPIFDAHNSYRAQHHVPALSWSDSLAAQAETSAARCTLKPDSSATAGENLFGTSGVKDPAGALKWAVETWYEGSQNYEYNKPGFGKNTGTFTQATAYWLLGNNRHGVLGNNAGIHSRGIAFGKYSPAGNVAGEYENNVLPPDGPRIQPKPRHPPSAARPSPSPNAPPPADNNNDSNNDNNADGNGLPNGVLPAGLMLQSPKCYKTDDIVYKICMQDDANIVTYKHNQMMWTSNTAGKSTASPFTLLVTDSGNLLAYDDDKHVFYSSV